MTKLYIGGVRGVGKTSSCLEMKRKYPDTAYVSDSELMMATLGLHTRDELWETSQEVLMGARRRAHKIFSHSSDMIVDGHFALFPDDVSRFDALALIDASSEMISRLRKGDIQRVRQASYGEIEEEKTIIRRQLETLEPYLGNKTIVMVLNDGTKAELFEKVESLWLSLKER